MTDLIKISKKLSWILRHGAVQSGLAIRADGYVKVRELMRTDKFRGTSLAAILEVVRDNSKQRFQILEEDGGEMLIRATQGHTMETVREEGLLQKIEPSVASDARYKYCIHGTYRTAVEGIRRTGLSKMRRNHIHMAASIPGMDAVVSGMRQNCDAVVVIDLVTARDSGGIDFYISNNNVILSRGAGPAGCIPPEFIVGIYDKREYVRYTSAGGPTNLPPTEISPVPTPAVASEATAAPQHHAADKGAAAGVQCAAPLSAREVDLAKSDKRNLYYCVIDFEATCERDSLISNQEIIEFPAVFINAETLAVEFEFHSYVKPLRNTRLSEFCTELTGIEQATVDAAPEFSKVFHNFCNFLAEYGFTMGSEKEEGVDCVESEESLRPRKNILFVTHGDWDLRTMLPQQCTLSNIKVPYQFKRWVNLKNVYKEWENQGDAGHTNGGKKKKSSRRGLGMENMLKYLDMELVGRHHSGIDDTRNIARMLVELCRRDAVISLPV